MASIGNGQARPAPFRVPACAARTLNVTGQSRVRLPLLQEHFRAARGPCLEGNEPHTRLSQNTIPSIAGLKMGGVSSFWNRYGRYVFLCVAPLNLKAAVRQASRPFIRTTRILGGRTAPLFAFPCSCPRPAWCHPKILVPTSVPYNTRQVSIQTRTNVSVGVSMRVWMIGLPAMLARPSPFLY